MKFFNHAFMNGAALFGTSITLLALTFAISDKLSQNQKIIFFLAAYLYLIASALASFFPSLNETKKGQEQEKDKPFANGDKISSITTLDKFEWIYSHDIKRKYKREDGRRIERHCL